MQASISELLVEAATLMAVGMTVVFVFLTILIGAVNFIAFINTKLPAEDLPSATDSPHRKRVVKNNVESVPIAAIAAAVHKYRSKN